MSFQLERNKANGGLPDIREKAVASGGVWADGALLTANANDEYAEVATVDPALNTIGAIALHAVGTGAGALYPIGRVEFPPNRAQAIPIREGLTFSAWYSGTLPATAGGSYGVVRGGDTVWRVDFSDTTATRVRLVDIDWTRTPLSQPKVIVTFLAGYQLIA